MLVIFWWLVIAAIFFGLAIPVMLLGSAARRVKRENPGLGFALLLLAGVIFAVVHYSH